MAVHTTTFVYQFAKVGSVGAWSRYQFPFIVDHYAQLDNDLYIRSGDDVLRVNKDVTTDFTGDAREQGFDGVVQTLYLDCGTPGATKRMQGFDLVSEGSPQVQFGYDQANLASLTTAFAPGADTLSGGMIPMPMAAASFSMKITFPGGANSPWRLLAANLYLTDNNPRR